jgi:hypothetical protein
MLLGQNFFSIIFFPFGCIICCGKMEEKLLGQIFFLLSFFSSFWCISCCGKMEEALLCQIIIISIIMIIIILREYSVTINPLF